MTSTKVDIWNLALDRIGETDALETGDDAEIADRPAGAVCKRHYDRVLDEVLSARRWPFAMRQRPLTEISDQVETYAYDAAVSDRVFEVPFAFLDSTQLEVVRIAASGAETTLTAVTDYTVTAAVDDQNASITLSVALALTAGTSVRVTVTTTRVGWAYLYTLPSDCLRPVALLYGDTRYSLLPTASRVPHAVMMNDAGDGKLLCCDMQASDIDALEYVMRMTYVPTMSAHFVNAVAMRLAMELASAIAKDIQLRRECERDFIGALSQASAFEMNVGHDVEPETPVLSSRG